MDNNNNILNLNLPKKENSKKDQVNKIKSKKSLIIDGFFGWNNIKWLMREFLKIYSDEPSYFSKKRIESSVAFAIAQWGMIIFLLNNYTSLSVSEFLIWASSEFVIAGYYVNQIQREKSNLKEKEY